MSLHKVSVLLKFLKQLVMDVFCSTSMLKSKKSSSLLVTVSQFKQRVSLVKMPWKISLIQVGFRWSLLESALEFLLGLPLTWFRSAEKIGIENLTFLVILFKTYQRWFHWYDWSKSSKIHGHLAACNYQNPLFLFVIWQWTFWVQLSRLFSFVLQWNKTNLLNMTRVFLCPSYFWPCIPGLFHGMVCKNTKLVAPNWNNMCYQTEKIKIILVTF